MSCSVSLRLRPTIAYTPRNLFRFNIHRQLERKSETSLCCHRLTLSGEVMSHAIATSLINSNYFPGYTATMVIYSKERFICDFAEEPTQAGRGNTPTSSALGAIYSLKSDVDVSSILYSYCFDAVSIKCPIKYSMTEVIQPIK